MQLLCLNEMLCCLHTAPRLPIGIKSCCLRRVAPEPRKIARCRLRSIDLEYPSETVISI